MLQKLLKNYVLAILLLFGLQINFAQNTKARQPKKETITAESMKAGALINVNVAPYPESNYTIAQLIKDVLITGGSTCSTSSVTNVTVSPNLPASDPERSWGYFNKGTTNFPFTEGIILTTGHVSQAGNTPQLTSLSETLGTSSDADLVTAINPVTFLSDAVSVEFDFVPNSTLVKFNYIFASEEYDGSFPCDFTDGFALLLKKVGDPTYTNLAILPAGGGAVSVTNIHPAIPGDCGAVNEQYFAGYNNSSVETNFNGRTIPLTSEATVIPGQIYHFKMVLADATDTAYDSGVFLEAGSFNIGVQILGPTGVVLPPTVYICDNQTQSLTASVQTASATFQWFNGTTAIPGATSATYLANQPGVYSVEVTVPGNACPGVASITIVGGTSPVVQNSSLTECYVAGNATFNLTSAQPNISTTTGATFTYYVNQADAIAENTNIIANPTAYSSAGNQTVYVLVKNGGFCSKVAELQLIKAAEITASIAAPATITCTVPQVTLNASASVYPTGSTFSWIASGGGNIVSGANTLSPVVNAGGTYTLTISNTFQPNNKVCSNTKSVTVSQDTTPPVVAVTATETTICVGESVTLTATGAATYNWNGLPGNTDTQTVSPNTTTTYTVYGVGANGCVSPTPSTVTITVVDAITSTLQGGQICPGDVITLDAGTGTNYTYSWNTGATTQTITTDQVGTYTVTISNGICSKQFSAVVFDSSVPVIKAVLYDNHTLTISAVSSTNGVIEYSIDGGISWQASNVFTNLQNNLNYSIKVRVKNTTCVGGLDYFTFFMPNIISPNGDGINDVVDFTGISVYENFAAAIYDRYGKEIFKADKGRTVWNGYFDNRLLPTSTYWYKMNWNDPVNQNPVEKTGWILLKNRN